MNNYYLGMMSGTSLDGVDLALVDFNHDTARIVAVGFMPMPENLRQKLTALLHEGHSSLQNLGEIDHQLGLLYAQSANQFLAEHTVSAEQVRAIGCHGQTIWHSPHGDFPFSMQIGDMNLVAAQTGIAVVADFRRKDMAYGGQGAPLVPAFHQAVFASPQYLTVVLNIGGISNISILNPHAVTTGYDIGPGNTLLDAWIERHLGRRYDKNGEWAKTGTINQTLLNALLNEPFFRRTAPKSTGRELFNLPWLVKKYPNLTALSAQDVQRTLVELTVQSITRELNRIHTVLPCRLLVCGGGAHNPLILQGLKTGLPHWQTAITTEYGMHADYVEAAAFAWLAYCRMNRLPSNLPAVTGAASAVSLGVIYPKE
ncbi:anhydro-N-acetylmuramic acid kinase [Actinobacillus succinogenes]|uniref:Anhydro-N-acetylmuramic acid kinase n=1 Tax=Actinobacillus succinogenes (strain ATCC 55618 / DSM 22257 / CCUG 43843 / 130Z) TaxID=339671 RepID=A6VKZ0_ACTSZ|nr:anhydro-N-acetylmuramic acid kinase [Actinobacillus succinogenes]ABR73637.1 protein of unknown function UPF0075 [Actinobacillus succinogenes 130Z]PHI39903.1 anhydro-N-acetylmuramic acid kinase [Actinobacillus succinogenes]